MLESYISPFLLGYVDKYIKNLKPEDLQLSLWGGDLVLNKLDLRLDVLEQELNLPLTFISGHIHELRIHVPWTRLGYEPVVITINTIECALKLKDAGYDEHDSASSKSSLMSKTRTDVTSKAKQKYEKQDRDLPPGYVQSLMNRVINNVRLVIKNLILKYVEDDIVLSVNVKSAESFAVNADWQSAFTELSLPELVLRRVCEFSDLTVCLDKRNASGKIEVYQEPMAYRCAVAVRIHMTYGSLHSNRPSILKVSVYCKELHVSLSDTQLPMLMRLLELLIALYYGTLDHGSQLESGDQMYSAEAVKTETQTESSQGDDPSSDGWASWAWSYVPDILYYDEEAGGASRGKQERRPDPLLSVGLYCDKASITFKLTKQISADHPIYPTSSSKLAAFPLLRMELSGSAIEILVQGEEFFVQQMGFSHITTSVVGNCVCGLSEKESEETSEILDQKTAFFHCGAPDYDLKQINYLTNCLFDENCPENKHQRASFIMDWDTHQNTYSEASAMQRFGAVWTDYMYLFVAQITGSGNASETSSRSSHHSADDTDPIFAMKETSSARFLISPARLVVGSSVVHRLFKVLECATNHEYEPYSILQEEIVDDNRPAATPEQISVLEEWVPSRSMHLTLLNLHVLFTTAEHPYYEMGTTATCANQGFQESKSTPALCFQADRIDVQTTEPMYPRQLVKPVSKVSASARSSKLEYNCYTHQYYKIFGCQLGLTYIDPGSELSPPILPIMPSWSAAIYHKKLVLPMYWKDHNIVHSEAMLELPSISCNATKAQCLLMFHIANTWLSKIPVDLMVGLAETSLIEDVFRPSVDAFPSGQPVLQASLGSLELKFTQTKLVHALSGTLSQVQVIVQALDEGRASDTPLFHGPVDTTNLHHCKSLMKQQLSSSQADINDLMIFTVQIPRMSGSKEFSEGSCGVFLVDIQGTAVCFDPIIYTWLLYQPRGQVRSKVIKEMTPGKIPRATGKPLSSEDSSQLQRVQSNSVDKPKPPVAVQRQSSTVSQPMGDRVQSRSWQGAKADKPAPKQEGNLLEMLWLVLKQLTIQVDIKGSFIAMPTDHLTFDSNTKSIPQCIKEAMLAKRQIEVAVVTLPVIKVTSLNHQKIVALQEVPVARKNLPPDTGEKLPWSVKASNCCIYTMHSNKDPHFILKPFVLSATVGITSTPSGHLAGARLALGLCIHADMEEIQMACSQSQVKLTAKLVGQALSNRSKLVEVFAPNQLTSVQTNILTDQQSPSKSAPKVLSSVASSGQPENADTTTMSISSPAETPVTPPVVAPSEEKDGNTPRLSLWLQWTLQKFCFSVYGGSPPRKISLEVEDLTTSVDFQDVYSKMACKVGSLNVDHYILRNETWQRGPFCGVVFSCTSTITRNTCIHGLQPVRQTSSRQFNPFSTSHVTKPTDSKSHGFLSVTWTRAQGKSLAQKLSTKHKESAKKPIDREGLPFMLSSVHEVVVSVQPFDILLWCPLYLWLLHTFNIAGILESANHKPGTSEMQPPKQPGRAKIQLGVSTTSILSPSDSFAKTTASQKSGSASANCERLSSRSLPLVYLDCKDIRVFAPTRESSSSSNTATVARSTEQCQIDADFPTDSQDTFLLQVSSIFLRPHADNPLQRLVIKKDVFRRAVQMGQTQTVGSAIEDRQYQLDVGNLNLSVASWHQIQACCNQGSLDEDVPGGGRRLVQNPALEWNMEQLNPAPKEVHLIPVVVGIDIRTVAAPAIITEKAQGSNKRRSTLITVCGHSVEVDFTSDMTFYLSTGQVCLLQTLLEENFLVLSKIDYTSPKNSSASPQPGFANRDENLLSNEKQSGVYHQALSSPNRTPIKLLDSGLGSDDSAQIGMVKSQKAKVLVQETSVHKIPSVSSAQAEKSRKIGKGGSFTPLDALLTMGKVSVFLYSCENTTTDAIQLEHLKPSQELETIEEGRAKLRPFLFVTFMQPAAVLSLEHQHQKLEFTVYDFTVDGASMKDAAREITVKECLPTPADYTMSWFETCPGEPHPKTGVRPALLTFTVNDCLSDQVATKLKIGRPTKLSFSLSNVDQATEFLRHLTPPKSIQIAAKPLMERESAPQDRGILIPILPRHPPYITHGNRRSLSQSHRSNTHSDVIDMLTRFKSICVEMTEFVVVMATLPDAANPHVVCSFSECQGSVDLSSSEGVTSEIRGSLKLDQLLMKTSVNQKTRPLIGPFSLNMNATSDWMPHSGSGIKANVSLGHVTAFLGQEHINCFSLMQQHLAEYASSWKRDCKETLADSKTQDCSRQSPWFQFNAQQHVICRQPDRHYKDDLRAGTFHYINDADNVGLRPKPGQIVFTCLALEDSSQGHWGSMTWCYPEPRIVTHVSVTPIPLHQAGVTEGDIDTAENEVPCTLEYWDVLKEAFSIYRQLYVSEVHSYHLTLPISTEKASRQAVASVWRVVLNSVTNDSEDEPLKPADHPGLIISPTSLAASMRIDSCFAAHLLPSISMGLKLECLEVRLAHHMDTLGKAEPAWLEPFVSDNLTPSDEEFMTIWLDSSNLYLHHWSSAEAITHAQMSTTIHCDLLTYRNLTMATLLHPMNVSAAVDATWGQSIEGCVDLGSVKVSLGQETVHTLSMAVQTITQANSADKERPLFCTYALCNDTNETLRFGQVHTDESVILPSRKVHEYSWRTHKHHRQRLHVCIEGWRNWRWSEPFSLDREGTIVRSLQYKEQAATLFIKIKKISTLQKQVIFCGQHIFRNSLNLDLELQLIRLAKIGSQVIDTKHFQSLSANSSLPSLTCSDSDITGVRIKLNKEGCDWSEQFALTGEMSREHSVLKVSDQDGVSHYMWCRIFTETHQAATQRMVLFSPLFIICNHLPWSMLMHIQTAKPYDFKVIQVSGRGSNQPLYQFAPAIWHSLTFQLGSDSSPSSPPMTINTDLVEQLSLGPATTRQESSLVTMETVTKESQLPSLMDSWPYNHLDYDCSKSFTSGLHHAELLSASKPPPTSQDAFSDAVYQPNTDLQISITRLSRYLNTITVDVLPWCLMVNETDLDIDVLEDGHKALRIEKGQTVVPQRFEEVFHLQLSMAKSRPVRLATKPISSVSHDPSTLTLNPEGYIHVTLSVNRIGVAQNTVVHLAVRSTIKHDIRVLTILPRFLLTNRSKNALLVRALDSLSLNKVTIQETLLQSVEVPLSLLDDNVTPLTQWNIPSSDQPIPTSNASLHETQDKRQYLSLAVAEPEEANQKADVEKSSIQKQTYWSRWAVLDISRPRVSVAVPVNCVFREASSAKTTSAAETLSTSPLLAVLAEQEGVMYITIEDDPMPRVILANAGSHPLHFGQVLLSDSDTVEVAEEHIAVPSVPIVLPHCLVHYDFQCLTPGTSADGVSRLSAPSIRLCLGSFPGLAVNLDRSHRQLEEEKQCWYSWSEAIQLAADNTERSEIVSLVGIGYILVSSHQAGSQLHVRIDPLSMDVSKTSVSSGIKSATEPSMRAEPNPLLAIEMDGIDSKNPSSGYSSLESTVSSKPLTPLQRKLKLSAGSVIFMIMDEVSDLVQTSEMLRVTIQDISLLSFPLLDNEKTNTVQQQQVQVSAGAFQIDNQSFKPMGRYDFAVILCNQNEATRFEDDEVPVDAPFEDQAVFFQKHHGFVSQVVLESCTDLPLGVASLNIALEPFELYVEDQFLYDLLVKIQTFIPARPHDQNQPITRHAFPEKVRVASRALKEPIGMRQFLIQPIRLLASVHASLKLFIAVDSTPLSFAQFDSGPMFATTRQLIQALTVHYTSGALFKAGWILGSLEILGNPAGLLRNVRSGLADSVMLPYEGLTRGPAAFVAGVTSGTSSLLKHLSAGTLTSITMFASSVSRNLDRLTLDEDHIARREKQRRKVPDRVTDGLVQGLSGFGLSLLGAIGGIADQPLRSFNEASEASSPTQKATGVIRGVGKGLMGVVIKPLGGAAEFVSQTGQGILHSTGLIETRMPKGECVTSLTAMANNSRLKYTWKMLQSLPNADILIHCDIITITFHGLQRGGALLLTPEVLFVVSASEDTQQQAFPVFEVDCSPLAGSQEGVCVRMKSRMSPSVSKKEETCNRVADFVGAIPTRPCDLQDIDPLVSSDSQSEVSSQAGGHSISDALGATVYQYFLQRACYRETFLSLFQQAKNRLVGKGFCYDETHNVAFSRFKMWHTSTKMELEGLE